MVRPVPKSLARAALFIVLAGTAPTLALEAQSARVLEVDDLFRLNRVGSPVVSPDGAWVAYTVSRTSLEEESSETAIWMAPTEGGDPIRMTGEESSGSRSAWSPDGRYLTFLASRGEDARTQVWAFDRRGGEAVALTSVKQGVSDYQWAPDSRKLALVVRDSAATKDGFPGSTRAPWVVDRLQFKRDGAGYLDDRQSHIHVFDTENKEIRQITSGRFSESQPRWNPAGTLVAFVSNRTQEPDANENSDIWVVAAANTDRGRTLRQVTRNPGSDSQPAWSPDGESIAYVTGIRPELIWYATSHLAVVPAWGGEPRLLTRELDRNVNSPRFSRDGGSVWFGLEDSAERHLARVDLESGEITRPIAGPRSVRGYDVAADGRIFALLSEPTVPGELFVQDGSELRRLTHANDSLMSAVRLGDVRNIHFPSEPGVEVEGFVFTPPDYREGVRYPTLLRIHGGPVSQYDFGFNFEAQLFAANGYVVLLTNPRGSSGYGQEFSQALWANWGVPDFADVMAGVDWVVDQGLADPDRLGVGGWSYGGILTNYVITKSDRFKAAITGASEVLFVANYGHDHYQRQWEAELGLPWENREAWERISPFNDIDKVVTPTLIMGGESDWNVPIQNSEQLYQGLKRRGLDTELVVYPGQSHGLSVPSYQKDRYQRYLKWYDRLLKPTAVSDQGGDR